MTRRSSASPATRNPYGSSSGFWPDPWTQFRRLSEQMDRWFDSFGMNRPSNRMSSGGEGAWGGNMWAPDTETFLRDDQFVIRMDLPGMAKDDVNVEIADDSIVIHGERQNAHEENRDGYYRSERSYGRFYREVPLPDGAQPETAKANYKDGVLEVTVKAPARQLNRPRRVEIGSSGTGEREELKTRDTTSPTGRPSVAHDEGNE
jgi:HSP20 family protein